MLMGQGCTSGPPPELDPPDLDDAGLPVELDAGDGVTHA
jgi:hypothetical protein